METNKKILEILSVDFLNFINFEIRKRNRWMNSNEAKCAADDPDDQSWTANYAEKEILLKIIKKFERIKKKNLKSPS